MGRQAIVKGDQRILGGFEWNNNARSHDAIALVHASDAATVTAVWAKVAESGNIGKVAGVASDQDVDLWLAYAELKNIPNNQIDVYALLLRNGNVTAGNLATSLYTIGGRLAGKVENVGVDYTVEVPFQFGDTGTQMAGSDGEFKGYAVFVKAGYTVPGENKVRLGAEYNLGSGDDNATDSESGAYVNMRLGTDHMHYGYMDINGNTPANRTHWGLNAKANATPELSVYGAYWSHKATEVAAGAEDDLGARDQPAGGIQARRRY